jgi:hypothetical protein
MTSDADDTLESRAARRRSSAKVTVGSGFPPSEHILITDPAESQKSMEALWELSCFVYQYPMEKRMDKTVVRIGRGFPDP